jgi:hypothetical protein
MVQRALKFYEKGQYSKSLEMFVKVLRIDPTNAVAKEYQMRCSQKIVEAKLGPDAAKKVEREVVAEQQSTDEYAMAQRPTLSVTSMMDPNDPNALKDVLSDRDLPATPNLKARELNKKRQAEQLAAQQAQELAAQEEAAAVASAKIQAELQAQKEAEAKMLAQANAEIEAEAAIEMAKAEAAAAAAAGNPAVPVQLGGEPGEEELLNLAELKNRDAAAAPGMQGAPMTNVNAGGPSGTPIYPTLAPDSITDLPGLDNSAAGRNGSDASRSGAAASAEPASASGPADSRYIVTQRDKLSEEIRRRQIGAGNIVQLDEKGNQVQVTLFMNRLFLPYSDVLRDDAYAVLNHVVSRIKTDSGRKVVLRAMDSVSDDTQKMLADLSSRRCTILFSYLVHESLRRSENTLISSAK